MLSVSTAVLPPRKDVKTACSERARCPLSLRPWITTDSDNNPKLVHVSYDQAKGKDDGEGKAGGKLVVEKTDQVMGSCAGAG